MSASAPVPEAGEPLLLFYDEQCGLCTRSVAFALARDRRGMLQPHPSMSQVAADRLGLASPRPLGALHAWSPSRGVSRGIDAVAAMLIRLPGWGWAGRFLRWPLVHPLASIGYSIVAANRHRFGAPVSCGLPTAASRQDAREVVRRDSR